MSFSRRRLLGLLVAVFALVGGSFADEPQGQPVVRLTPAAAEEIKTLMREQKLPADRFLRITVGPTTPYMMGFGREFDPARDVESTSFGVRIVVSRESAKVLQGTIIDYETKPVPGFRFKKGR